MKNSIKFLTALIICLFTFAIIKIFLLKDFSTGYYDELGNLTISAKFKNIRLENMAINTKDTVFLLGSSEFENTKDFSVNPINFFKGRKAGYQTYFNGKVGYQTLVHAVEMAAIDNNIENQKVVFVLSPQWFLRSGIKQSTFEGNSSQLQCLEAILNDKLSTETKEKLIKRILAVTTSSPTTTYPVVKNFYELALADDNILNLKSLLNSNFKIQYKLLTFKDKLIAFSILKTFIAYQKNYTPKSTEFNWDLELLNATSIAEKTSTNNPFGMDDYKFNTKFKDNLNTLKDSKKDFSFPPSPEYDDLKLLFDIFKDKGVEPLIVNIPCNGFWYDYIGFNKDYISDYNNNIKTIVDSYGFKLADFSSHEYDKYFLRDGTHLGWRGWVYVNKAIYEYYKENKK